MSDDPLQRSINAAVAAVWPYLRRQLLFPGEAQGLSLPPGDSAGTQSAVVAVSPRTPPNSPDCEGNE